MQPVPTHLREVLHPHSDDLDEEPVVGELRCPCGSQGFHLRFPGQTHEHAGREIPCVAEVEGEFFFRLDAVCAACGRGHLLLDQDLHGWNGLVCREPEQAARPRPPLQPWACRACGELSHAAEAEIAGEGREDFEDEAGDLDLDPERWPDAFGSFALHIRCSACGVQTPEWVVLETM